MKAVTIRAHGGPEVVGVEDVPAPAAAAGEVVVAVRAAALNHLDIWVRKGGRNAGTKFPHVLGSDASGRVAEVGAGVTGVRPGDEVILFPGLSCGRCEACRRGQESECDTFGIIGLTRWGTFAERVAVPAGNVFPKPPTMDFEDAAALPVAYTTAWRMLTTRAALGAGETVLIHGIGGGVALAGLQFAKRIGARAIVTSSSEEKLARAAKLGADISINYRTTPDLVQAVMDQTRGRGVDVVMDTVGAATWPVDFAVVRKGGRIVLCGVTGGADAPTSLRTLYWNQVSVLGSTLGSHEDFRRMLRAVAEAPALKPVLDSTVPLDQAPHALARMEVGRQFGKIVLDVSG